ncbi:ABC transporter ATP-binding protein [Candidatus Caldatribacterium sp.]|uniref:ABC transporter ATP-binding protein n=1 Tax=Candidatus Caldatribacterium sp. TaxID=2282143 RepID=UPI00299B5632|nr:ABC transporter ATP-binding protein [Candidatus Caldatribacterium sp.]MDW8080604.1 ABC transporter ATP-binding protein [Candidatus Calescibacterium sp.]
MLRLEKVTVKYGVIPAVQELNLEVRRGQIVALLGANGAGKTTTLKTVVGVLKPAHGRILYDGKDITTLPAPQRVRMGICLVPEGRGIFGRLTVRENLLLGAYHRKDQKEVVKDLEEVYRLFPRLKEREHQIAGTLSGGEQQMLAIGRGLMSRPKLMLLDEPSLGLAPLIVRELYALIRSIRERGVTILLVEQSAPMAIGIADYVYVLETGTVKISGTPEDVESLEEVKKVYLGG